MFRTSGIIRYINQNRKKIVLVIGSILGIIVVIQLLNSFAAKQNKISSNENTTNTQTSSVYNPNKTVITDTEIKEEQAEQNTEIIDNFVQYCNNGEIQKAYDLLSEACKEEMYPTLERFENSYYEKVFQTKKEYNIQSWMTTVDCYTYKIRYLENMLSSGQYNSSEIMEDYITIVEEDNEVRLNINYYVGREEVNKKQEKNGITITILNRESYIEYEKYTIKVENTTDEKVILDNLETVDGIKLFGENDVEYQAFTNELSNYDVKVASNSTKTLQIKFAKSYNTKRKDKKILFSNITLNAEDNIEEDEETENIANEKIQIGVELR